MKVKIFQTMSFERLEKKVNEFLNQENIEVLKVHFDTNIFAVSALVEYKEK